MPTKLQKIGNELTRTLLNKFSSRKKLEMRCKRSSSKVLLTFWLFLPEFCQARGAPACWQVDRRASTGLATAVQNFHSIFKRFQSNRGQVLTKSIVRFIYVAAKIQPSSVVRFIFVTTKCQQSSKRLPTNLQELYQTSFQVEKSYSWDLSEVHRKSYSLFYFFYQSS